MDEKNDEQLGKPDEQIDKLTSEMCALVDGGSRHFGTLNVDQNKAEENVTADSTQPNGSNEKGKASIVISSEADSVGGVRVSVNVGILGHVDCGKTTLARAISSLASTAAFDKHAKAENLRANTIDLGFSSVTIDRYTVALIDCPGHASLIGAVLAASSVFDMAIIVVDAQKGVQPQTAEHLLLVSILCPQHVVIVINKVDLVSKEHLESLRKQTGKVLKYFGIVSQSPVVCVSLLDECVFESAKAVIDALKSILYEPERRSSGHFVMSVDHCFPIRGKGTVMTGTLIDGSCSVGMEVEIAMLKEKRKVKGIQRWKEDVKSASMGERVGVLFQDLPHKHIDRTVIFQPGALQSVQFALATITKIPHFKSKLSDRTKIHVSIGFETVMATCQFLVEGGEEEYEQFPSLEDHITTVLMIFDHPIYARVGSFYMASKLDMQGKGCRFAFYGNIGRILHSSNEVHRFHRKHRSGCVDRIEPDKTSLICSSLFSKESNIGVFLSMTVSLSTGERGIIEGPFGRSGKTRVRIPQGISKETVAALERGEKVTVELWMKKYVNTNMLLSYVP